MIYYLETDLVAMIVAATLLHHERNTSSKNETSHIIMNRMLWLLIVFSACDIAAYYSSGKNYLGVQLFNTLYLICMGLGNYAWFMFVMVKMGHARNMRKTSRLSSIPIVVLCIAIAGNFLTSYFFAVDAQNRYHRGAGILITWVIEWSYMLMAVAINIRAVVKEKRSYHRKELAGYLIFVIPLAAAAVCQMVFYGVTSIQIGYMLALLMVFSNKQQHQAQRDELTGMNNRNAFLRFQDAVTSRSTPTKVTIFMMDMDHFKQINDAYGHVKGDQALVSVSDALKAAAGALTQNRVILYRYGGDEFLIAGSNMTEEQCFLFLNLLYEQVEQANTRNAQAGEQYTLGVSVGYATRNCLSMGDFNQLLKEADENMYQVKKAKKANAVGTHSV